MQGTECGDRRLASEGIVVMESLLLQCGHDFCIGDFELAEHEGSELGQIGFAAEELGNGAGEARPGEMTCGQLERPAADDRGIVGIGGSESVGGQPVDA